MMPVSPLFGWSEGLALAVAAIAVVTDVKYRKIPNWLTFSAMTAGIAMSLFFYRVRWPLPFLGIGTGLLLMLIPFAVGGVGAGDLKLLMALGALLGSVRIFWIVLLSGMAGGFFSLLYMGYKLRLSGTFFRLKLMTESLWNRRRGGKLRSSPVASRRLLPFIDRRKSEGVRRKCFWKT
jgi:prepilin peptidase CpaA